MFLCEIVVPEGSVSIRRKPFPPWPRIDRMRMEVYEAGRAAAPAPVHGRVYETFDCSTEWVDASGLEWEDCLPDTAVKMMMVSTEPTK